MPVYKLVNPRLADIDGIVIRCQCGFAEHELSICTIDWSDEGTYSVSIHLSPVLGFWERAKLGVKYIFGYRSKYGEFAEILIDRTDVKALIEYFERK